MPESGARPKVPARRRAVLRAARAITTPLLPDDFLELFNPLWSSRELRGRVERVEPQTAAARTVVIRPGWDFGGHEPGQYIRVGFDVGGVRHWRAYSLTSDPRDDDGVVAITVKGVDAGTVSSYVNHRLRPGTVITLGEVAGEFTLPDPVPGKLLFISAGSGVTPVMGMLRHLDRRGALADAVHVHSARTPDDVIFGEQLRDLERRTAGYRLHERHTSSQARFAAVDLDDLCPDWTDRETFLSGPPALLDALIEHWRRHGDASRLHVERFQPVYGEGGDTGDGGTVSFLASGTAAAAPGGVSILVAGEHAGLELPFGCRMGICHTCVGRVRCGRVRDLRSGAVEDAAGQTVRTCIHAPEGDVEIAL